MNNTKLHKLISGDLKVSKGIINELYTLDYKLKPLEVESLKDSLDVTYEGLGYYDLTAFVEEVYLKIYYNKLLPQPRQSFILFERLVLWIKNLFSREGCNYTSTSEIKEKEKAYLKVERIIGRGLRSCNACVEELESSGKVFHPVKECKYFTVGLDTTRGYLSFTLSAE